MSRKKIGISGSKQFIRFYKELNQNDKLKQQIDEAMTLMKSNPTAGDKIEKHLWPKRYIDKYDINNLFRYKLGQKYRMIYTIIGNSKEIVCIIIDVLSHKEYDELFGYKTS